MDIIGKAMATLQRMNKIWSSLIRSLKSKFQLLPSIVILTAIYPRETWKASVSINKRLDIFQQRCLWPILKMYYFDHITTEEVFQKSFSWKLHNTIGLRRHQLACHILHMENSWIPKMAVRWTPFDAKQSRRCPQNTWQRTFMEDLKILPNTWEDAEVRTQNRKCWSPVCYIAWENLMLKKKKTRFVGDFFTILIT